MTIVLIFLILIGFLMSFTAQAFGQVTSATYDKKWLKKEIKRLIKQSGALDHNENLRYGADQSSD